MEKIVKQLKTTDTSPEYYKRYPRLFQKYFSDVDPRIVATLSDTGYVYYHSVLALDAILDKKDISLVPRVLMLQEEAVKQLARIYDGASAFWNYWDLRKKEYFEAVKIEKQLNGDNAQWDTYAALADKKSAFGKIAIDCLYCLSSGKHQLYEVLLKSHACFSVGFQLYDDVKDFGEDLQNGQFNWAVHKTKAIVKDAEEYRDDPQTLHKLLFVRGVGQDLLELSISYFEQAADVLKNYNINSEWLDVISLNIKTIQGYLDGTNGYLSSIIKKLELKEQVNTNPFMKYQIDNEKIQKGLDYIRDDYSRNYAELQHVMFLSRLADGFENCNQIHHSDTFQRAMLNDCLIDICRKYNIDFKSFIEQEIAYLAGRRNTDSVGGWSYFPTVGEIAPDIDDLGQIMQLFIKAGRNDLIEKYCAEPIRIALSSRYNTGGGIGTWIIPDAGRTEMQERQVFFNETKWGTGPDVEVVANFIYALYLYDYENYKHLIHQAIGYIVNNQHENGYWISRWYYGNLYGTYACLRLLKHFENNETAFAIEIAQSYLLCAQSPDGGYGMDENSPSDALSTTFALMSLKLCGAEFENNIRLSERFLENCQHKDGYWEAVNFIKPKADEPYKSRTLTTALVLKSLAL